MQKQGGGNDKDAGPSSSSGILSTSQFFNSLNKYIPSLVIQNWIEKQVDREQLEEQLKYHEQRVRKNKNNEDAKYKVSLLTQQLSKHKTSSTSLPYIQDMETVVLFADISGFTNVSEACASMGIRGPEELAFCINRYMEGCIKNLSKYGGDVIKFVGDAMIVMWPTLPKEKKNDGLGFTSDPKANNEDDERVNTIRKAIQCGFDIQKEMNNKKITAKVTSLSVKIGIGYGKCSLLYVGGLFNRSEYMTVGSALMSALGSEGEATSGGQIIVSDTAFKYVKDKYYEGIEIISEEGKKFYRVTKVREGIRGRADAVLLKQQMKLDRIVRIQSQLRSCVPNAIMPYIEIGMETYGSETRAVTVMFASLGVDLSSASGREGMLKIQKIVTTVQQMVYRLEGSVNKLVLDDKGSTLICIWGLCPLAHSDDPQRAILTALNMRRELLKVDKTWLNVGIATGDVFTGVVGTSGSRKEFSVLGDTVNLAARIMFWPLKKNRHGCINVCFRTKNESMNQVSFNYGGHCEFKGKSISIPIFEVIDPFDEFVRPKIPQQFLKLWYNPVGIVKQVNHRRYSEKFIDSSGFVGMVYEKIKSYFFRQQQDPDRPALSIIIQGEIGSGKTHSVRSIIEKMQKDQEFIQDWQMRFCNNQDKSANFNVTQLSNNKGGNQNNQVTLPIFASSVNAEQKLHFLGLWIPILRMMFDQNRKQCGLDRMDYFKIILQDHYEKIDLFADLFDIDEKTKKAVKGKKNIEQIKMTSLSNPYYFLVQENYESDQINCVLDLLVEFIKDFAGIEQYADTDNMTDCAYSEKKSTSNSKVDARSGSFDDDESYDFDRKKNPNKIVPTHRRGPTANARANSGQLQKLMLVFDNASNMSGVSYSLLLRVWAECPNICIVILVQQDYSGNPYLPTLEKPIQKENKGSFYTVLDQELEIDWKKDSQYFDIPRLSKEDLKKVLVEMAPKYNEAFTEEMESMIAIINPQATIKKPEKCAEWRMTLTNLWNLGSVYTSIEDQVVDIIVKKCDGNPLICLQFFTNLIQNSFLTISEDNQLIGTAKLQSCITLKNFTSVPVPSCAHKNRLKNIDTFIKSGRKPDEKNQKKKEMTIKGVIIMKSAAAIGEDFGTLALKKIMPLRNETTGSLLMILKLLEQYEFIEILDETDSKDIRCRFNRSFLRESLYQIMLYKDQKQVLHRQLAEHMQSLPVSYMDQSQIELELIKLKDHIMKGEDVTEESELPYKHKQGLIIKQMQFQLLTNNSKKVLYRGWVQKQGKGANKKVSFRMMYLTSKDLTWYHDAAEYEQNKQALGEIKIESIYKCNETLLKETTYDFEICITTYIAKGKLIENQPRVMKFGCVTDDERQGWISRIEFLKTKVVYDTYVNKFVNIQFPLKKIEENDDNEDSNNDAIYEKLSKFGQHFKQTVRINHNVKAQHPSTKAMMKQKTTFSNFSGSAKLNASLRKMPTTVNHMRQSFVSYGIQQELDLQSDRGNEVQVQTAQSMKEQLKSLYRTSLVCFMNQTTVNSNKSQNQSLKNKSIGTLPEYLDLENDAELFAKTTDESDGNSIYRQSTRDDNKRFDQKQKSANQGSRESSNSALIEKIDEQSEKSSSDDDTSKSKSVHKDQKISMMKNQPSRQTEIPKIKKKVKINLHQRQSEQISKEDTQQFADDLMENVHHKKSHENLVTGSNSNEKTSNSATQVSAQIRNLEEQKKIQRNSLEELKQTQKYEDVQHRFTFNKDHKTPDEISPNHKIQVEHSKHFKTKDKSNQLQSGHALHSNDPPTQINANEQRDQGVYNSGAMMKQSIHSSTQLNLPPSDYQDKQSPLPEQNSQIRGQRNISPIDGVSSIHDNTAKSPLPDPQEFMLQGNRTHRDLSAQGLNMSQLLNSGNQNVQAYHQNVKSQAHLPTAKNINFYNEPQQLNKPAQPWPIQEPYQNNQMQHSQSALSFPSAFEMQQEINRQVNLGIQQVFQNLEQKLQHDTEDKNRQSATSNYNMPYQQYVQAMNMRQPPQQFTRNDDPYKQQQNMNILDYRESLLPNSLVSFNDRRYTHDQNETTQKLQYLNKSQSEMLVGGSNITMTQYPHIQGGVGSRRKDVMTQDIDLQSKQSVRDDDDDEPLDPELDVEPQQQRRGLQQYESKPYNENNYNRNLKNLKVNTKDQKVSYRQ